MSMMLEHMDASKHLYSPEQVPAHVREYASKHNLGLPLMASRNQRLVLLSLIGRMLQVASLIGVMGWFIKWYIDGIILDRTYPLPASNHSEQIFQQDQQIILLTIGMTAFYVILCGFTLWRYYRGAQQKLYLCQGGLLRLGKDKEEALHWEEVVDMYGASDKLVVLHGEGARRFAISESWPHNKEFDRRVAHILVERLLPQAIERFNKGLPISFGPLLINNYGIRYIRQFIPWEELEDIREDNGAFTLKTQGEWQRYEIIDAPLIVALVTYILRARLIAVIKARIGEAYQGAEAYRAIEPRYSNANRKLAE